jgi:ferritin
LIRIASLFTLVKQTINKEKFMISKKMEKMINEQINHEMYSAYLYLSMSAYFEGKNLPGFANWMYVQYQEETFHAMKFFKYILDRGGRIELEAIAGPEKEWPSPLAVFEATYKHELKVTSLIHALVDLAITEKDHASNALLQWYVTEQVEEEANDTKIIDRLKRIGNAEGGLYMLDAELAKRVYTPPVAGAAT